MALSGLLLHLPNFLISLFVMWMLSELLGAFGFLLILVWVALGALVFHRPAEAMFARHVLRLRRPTPQEQARLALVWQQVASRSGVSGGNYELWIEDSNALNAVAAAGHIVGVTRFAVHRLTDAELAAVLSHELGHHVGGHAWSSLLGYWYALPGRVAWRTLRAFSTFAFRVSRAFGCLGVAFVVMSVGVLALAAVTSLYGVPLLLLAVPYALAAVGRRAELRADRHAAALGFGPPMTAVLVKMEMEEARRQALAADGKRPELGPLTRWLGTHPDYATRLDHLSPYLPATHSVLPVLPPNEEGKAIESAAGTEGADASQA
ncbi:M48 family metalloprotease [Streptomyces albidoflavus]|uniref:M48 family metalloprotease n=1 Tax=Streptomyces albidoflavus TaxID=1886 RepID=UPI003327195F